MDPRPRWAGPSSATASPVTASSTQNREAITWLAFQPPSYRRLANMAVAEMLTPQTSEAATPGARSWGNALPTPDWPIALTYRPPTRSTTMPAAAIRSIPSTDEPGRIQRARTMASAGASATLAVATIAGSAYLSATK